MITCAECIERLYPSDPRVRSGRYMKCGCDYCDKPTYYLQLEQVALQPKEQVIVHRHSNLSKQEWDLFQQTVRKVQFLENKIDEITKRRKPELKYGYKGIR